MIGALRVNLQNESKQIIHLTHDKSLMFSQVFLVQKVLVLVVTETIICARCGVRCTRFASCDFRQNQFSKEKQQLKGINGKIAAQSATMRCTVLYRYTMPIQNA